MPDDRMADDTDLDAERRRLRRQAVAIALAVSPFGVAFGAACAQAGVPWLAAMGFSTLVFTGGSQFAAISVLSDGGRAVTAITAGLLLALRSIAYGVLMSPHLSRRRLVRVLESQLMIDEAVAVSTATERSELRRYGYLWGGGSVFVLWNIATLVGAIALRDTGDAITNWGLDATIPASFLALVWPRLLDSFHRATALVGAAIAFVTIPLVPAGLPIILAGIAVIIIRQPGSPIMGTPTKPGQTTRAPRGGSQ
jgi:predicted branched-subunit amino acid permease